MTYTQVSDALRAHLEALVLSPVLPIVWENTAFNPETQGGEAGWLLPELHLLRGEQVSFGDPTNGNTFRDFGLWIVNVVTPRAHRIGRSPSLAEAVRLFYKAESISGVHFTNRYIGQGRLPETQSRWYATPVLMEWWADRIETPA